MASAAARAPNPETRKAGALYTPTSANFITSNSDEDNLTARRVQRLVDRLGISERRARVFAELAFGGAA